MKPIWVFYIHDSGDLLVQEKYWTHWRAKKRGPVHLILK